MKKSIGWALALASLALACVGPSGSEKDPEELERERAERAERRAEREERRRHEPIELPRRTPGSY